jgi:hypothetical protein
MVKNWSRIVLVSLLALAIAAPAFATTARVRSMANTGDYLSDDSNVFRWYSTLPSYAKMVQAELGTKQGEGGLSNTRALGFNYACGEDGKWGTYRISLLENAVDHPGFYQINNFLYNFAPGDAANLGTAIATPVNKWDLAGGWEIGETIVLGFAYTRSSWKYEDEQNRGTQADPTTKASVSWSTFGLGFTWTNNEDMIFDAAVTYVTAGGEIWTPSPAPAAPATTKLEWDKSGGFDLSARMFYDWKDYVTLVPLFEYASSDYALKTAPNAVSVPNGDKDSAFLFGAGLDIEVNGSNTLIFAAEYNWYKWEYSVADTLTSPPASTSTLQKQSTSIFPTFRLALESEITSWLTTRIGAVHRNVSTTQTRAGKDEKWTNDTPTGLGGVDPGSDPMDNFDWFLGCGFNVAEWTIDMELAEETPFNLGYWITGYSGNWGYGGPVSRISAVYNF